MNALQRWLLYSPGCNFNLVERDRAVAHQAASVPLGSKVLDIGAGSRPCRRHLSGSDLQTGDFVARSARQLRNRQGYGQIDYVCDSAG